MEQDICERCFCTIADTAGIVCIMVNKPHTLCLRCWEEIRPRWFRRLKKYFPLMNLTMVMSPYIQCDVSRRLTSPLNLSMPQWRREKASKILRGAFPSVCEGPESVDPVRPCGCSRTGYGKCLVQRNSCSDLPFGIS
jgi:hypothetical protein